ncbi:PhzF family phenazine biosynthesis protein [Pelagibacterium halotolerans]|uniref:Phenazine biosynthesis protein PhzF like protein n=1 Tax=Pelagibacterium halotolerans (strain DSM 22347 / JCM 15775 / CGMCC 1.7692 / B2) TaxID=1082931 RepID=G4REW1_PELHB|nr:PhzF family phenazine biosynthesis protein [Pelagibacterium halotolerans]AEQ51932.1 phenazine biosynthesis protein PhzF like protein [Pelagibacterium halotolerans B2]QJR20554.1 PhzF family phenazine biosynthesis protein [Pelagibacterium halotolerans]SEA27355.1 trans-2,3-dihydro-3-hydroxyanthranilate isomerase [Pelagibacterium halotolerans]
MKLTYFILDVFTRDRLSGNPLAVVLRADELSTTRMQAIAGEFNLSETVFVCAPKGERHTAALRIFTPVSELPFAGHPTVGAAVLLGLQHKQSAVRLELGVGNVTAVMERIDKRTGEAKFALPRKPERVGELADLAGIAERLGISVDDIGCDGMMPAQYSAGNPFYLVPLRDASLLTDMTLERRGWADTFSGPRNAVYVFAKTPKERGNDYAARMFHVSHGTGEDAATGSAAAALIGLLAEHGGYGDGSHTLKIRQGREMGRPSEIGMQFNIEGGQLKHAGIGGAAVVLAEGVLDFDD